ncbi:RHS repeat-associated core domain-containing protein [Vibrio ruber]|uniref:RHS repeat-associated core domain-containing protein n=1 Tax=Vibrio ruber TaxID=184755 RepID=UPI0028934D18|nr:RHS repeat-associated core domain-containing protein [Vibrio ruber]WNJ97894.1 RHS repeat-associated core domain-containing protein [Vibrio ruber]
MARKAKYVDIIGKIEKLVKLVQEDADKGLTALKKLSQHGKGDFNKGLKKNQLVDGERLEGATGQARKAKQQSKLIAEEKIDNVDKSGKTPNDKPADKVENTCTNGCPVSMVTGEELLALEDATLPGALPFTFSRTYRTSGCEINAGLGYGWGHSLSHQLEFKNGEVLWRNEENRMIPLPEPTESRPEIFNNLAGAAIFLGSKSGEYVLAAPGKPFYHFERQGDTARLVRLSDNYNNTLSISYDRQQRPQAVVSPHGIALWLTYENDLITQIELKSFRDTTEGKAWTTHRLLHQYTYNDQKQLIAESNEAGLGERYAYDTQHVITKRTMAGGIAFGWEWEGEGKDVRCIRHWSNTGYLAEYVWDDEARTVTVVNSDGSQEIYQHDESAKLISTTDPDGAVTTHAYNDSGYLVSTVDALGHETRHVYNNNGDREATIAPDGTVTEFQYLRGKIFKVIQGEAVWRYFHNMEGDLTEKRDPLGNTTFYHYNEIGRLSKIDYPDGSTHQLRWNRLGMLIGETYPDGSDVVYRHDISGRVIYEKSSIGGVTEYQWDEADRLVAMISGGKIKRFTYNGYGKVTQVTDESGLKTQYEYGENSHLVSRVVNPDGTSLSYRYDNVKNFVSEITNERGETHSIGYYPNGLVQTENTFDGRTFSYEYDLLGQLTKKTETGTAGTALTTEFERDVMGRLVKKTLADGSSIDYRYDEYGNLSEVDDGERPLVWRYDLMGRVTEEHQDWASNYFSYDALGQVESWQLPDANVLKYQRGRGGVLKQIDLNDLVLTRHLYQSGLEKERHQGAVISSFDHDEQGRLTCQQRSLNRQVTRKRDYSYDARGNLTHISDSKDGDIHFDYDPLSRLKAVRGNIEERFVHDATGNVLSQILGRHDGMTRDKLGSAQGNQLAFHGDSHYEYDEFGRLMTEKRGKNQSLITTYEYDCQHRLIKASLPDGTIADYKYDAFGRRTHKTVTDKAGKVTTTEYLWQGDNLIGETTDTNYQSYIYEPGTFKPLALLKGEGKAATPYYYHLDQIGTPTEITDVAGQSVWAVQYRAYGSVLTQQVEEIQSPLRFQGQYYDAETGLHYNRHRYYSPETGRFTTADPIGLAGGLNNYQYALNPTGWVDPLGLAVIVGQQCSESAARRAEIISAIEKEMQPVMDYIHKLDPDAQLGFRGSLASGVKGPHKLDQNMGRVPFDGNVAYKLNKQTGSYEAFNGPQGYDLDLFVVSDKLASRFKKVDWFKNLTAKDPKLRGILESVRESLNNSHSVKGLKQESIDIRVWTKKEINIKLGKNDVQAYFNK